MTGDELAIQYQQDKQPDTLYALWRQVQKLCMQFVRPYRYIISKNNAIDYDDVEQASFLAVERAVRAYRPDDGAFGTILNYYVKSEMNALLGLQGRTRQEHYNAISADVPMYEDSTASVIDNVADDSLPDADDGLLSDDVGREVRAAIERLSDKQARVVRGCYLEGLSLVAVAEREGMQPGQAGNIRHEGKQKLRRDWRLRRLAEDALCYRHVGARAFRHTWTSSTEAAALRLLGER